MGDAEDFWPTLEETEDAGSPVVILRNQAEKLTEKYGRRLRGRVSTATGRLSQSALAALGIEQMFSPDNFTHTFAIEVPALDDYSFTLFAVSHSIAPYPVAYQNEDGEWHALADRQAFIDWFKQTLSSERTKRVLKTLLEQAN